MKYSKLLTSRVNKCWNTQTQVFDLDIDLANYRSWSFISNTSIIICAELFLLVDLHPCQRSQLPSIGVTTEVLWPKQAWWMSLRRRWDPVLAQSLFFTVLCVLYASVSQCTVRCIDGPWASGHSDSKAWCPGAGSCESLVILQLKRFSIVIKRAPQRDCFSFIYTYITIHGNKQLNYPQLV